MESAYAFSWSVTAWQCFTHCPRAYFYRYPGAWGGADPHAPREVRMRHLLKRQATIAAWADRAFRDGIRAWLEEGWRRPPSARRDAPEQAVLSRLKAGWGEACGEVCGDDPRRTVFREWADSGPPPDAASAFGEIRHAVLARLARFRGSRTCAEIMALPYLAVRDLPVPVALPVAGVKTWCAPLLAWHRDGQVHVLHLHPRDRAAHPSWDWQAGVGELLARQCALRLRLPPGRATVVRSLFLGEPGEAGLAVYATRHPDEVAATIQDSAQAMDRGMDQEAYPPAPSPEACHACDFRALCPDSP